MYGKNNEEKQKWLIAIFRNMLESMATSIKISNITTDSFAAVADFINR